MWQRDSFVITTDKHTLDIEMIHTYLTDTYWGQGRSLIQTLRSIQNALCFGLYHERKQIGFARVITDFSVLAYLGDVFILPPYQNQGLGKWLVETILNSDELKEIRSWLLATRDAHGLYEKFGFLPAPHPERYMTKKNQE